MKFIVKTVLTAALILGVSNASAAVITSTDIADFNLTSESFATAGFSNSNLVSVSGNLTLDNAEGIGNPATGTAGYSNFTGALSGDEYVLNGDENFNLIFSSTQTAFAMDYVDASIASTFNLTFFDGASNVGSTSFATSSFGTAEFIGFISTVGFDRVEIREDDGVGNTDEFFQFYAAEAVSEPGSLLIFGLDLVGLGYARRRKAAQNQ
ncbi:MAG: hypothetical protein CMM52_01265 [Rhodospirillaceae bacterium]|nr:hypothetical protein [Rhodospirillaceae bacterium]